MAAQEIMPKNTAPVEEIASAGALFGWFPGFGSAGSSALVSRRRRYGLLLQPLFLTATIFLKRKRKARCPEGNVTAGMGFRKFG